MKISFASISIAAVVLALSSGLVISKNTPVKVETHPKTRISVAHLTSIDALGDIGDEFMSECQITNTGKQPTCEQLWAGLGKIAANSPDGVQ